ncbi:hypothetical protein CapIbe_007255 [Capra ibex]
MFFSHPADWARDTKPPQSTVCLYIRQLLGPTRSPRPEPCLGAMGHTQQHQRDPDSEIHIEEAPEDAYGSGHHGPEPAPNPETLLL